MIESKDAETIEDNKESIKTSSNQTPSPSFETLEVNAEDAWDLLLISDSTGWGVADQFIPMVEADLGIKIKRHNFDRWSQRSFSDQLLAPPRFPG